MSRAQLIIEKMVAAHVDAPPGAGKTTLMNKLSKEFPEFVFVDVDQFRGLAHMHLVKTQGSYRHEEFVKLANKKYNQWRRRQTKPIVLFGLGEDFLFKVEDPSGKIHMKVNTLRNAYRIMKRDYPHMEKIRDAQHPLQRKIIKVLMFFLLAARISSDNKDIKLKGYGKVRPGGIKKRLKQISQRVQSNEQS